MSDPKPCPFCGRQLRYVEIGSTVTFQHPTENVDDCFLVDRGFHGIREHGVDLWDKRPTVAGAAISYEIREGLPTFNDFGQGTKASAKFLNECFMYLWSKISK